MARWPGDLSTPRDKATGLDLARALCHYLQSSSGEDSFTVVTDFPLAVAMDTARRRAIILTCSADHAAGEAPVAETIRAVVAELDEMGIPRSRMLATDYQRWSPDGEFTREFGLTLDRWLYDTAPERVRELNEQFKREVREKGN